MSWKRAVEKFEKLTAPYTEQSLCREIIRTVSNLEAIQVSDLTKLLAEVKG
jgi:hypothetical protein